MNGMEGWGFDLGTLVFVAGLSCAFVPPFVAGVWLLGRDRPAGLTVLGAWAVPPVLWVFTVGLSWVVPAGGPLDGASQAIGRAVFGAEPEMSPWRLVAIITVVLLVLSVPNLVSVGVLDRRVRAGLRLPRWLIAVYATPQVIVVAGTLAVVGLLLAELLGGRMPADMTGLWWLSVLAFIGAAVLVFLAVFSLPVALLWWHEHRGAPHPLGIQAPEATS